MTDIVERLRTQRTPALFETAREAADEIARLRAVDVNSKEAALWSETMSLKSRNEWLEAEIERLRAALREIVETGKGTVGPFEAIAIARRALEPKP